MGMLIAKNIKDGFPSFIFLAIRNYVAYCYSMKLYWESVN